MPWHDRIRRVAGRPSSFAARRGRSVSTTDPPAAPARLGSSLTRDLAGESSARRRVDNMDAGRSTGGDAAGRPGQCPGRTRLKAPAHDRSMSFATRPRPLPDAPRLSPRLPLLRRRPVRTTLAGPQPRGGPVPRESGLQIVRPGHPPKRRRSCAGQSTQRRRIAPGRPARPQFEQAVAARRPQKIAAFRNRATTNAYCRIASASARIQSRKSRKAGCRSRSSG